MSRVPRQIILIAVLAGVLGGGYLIERSKQKAQSVLTGTFETQPALLASRVGGRVKSIPVNEGDMVQPGEKLVVLEAAPDLEDTRATGHDLKQAEQAFLQATLERKEQIAEQQDVVNQLQAELTKDLNGSRPEDIASARAVLANFQAKLDEAVRGPRLQEIGQARALVAASKANLEKVRRGGSVQERARLEADLETARTTEAQAKTTYQRQQALYDQDAVSAQSRDDARSNYEASVTRTKSALHALEDQNSRPEDIALAQHQLEQNQQNLDLLLAGTRPEEIQADRATRDQAAANLKLLLDGTRPEDIAEARAKLAQAQEALSALKDGSRNQSVAEAQSRVRESSARFLSAQDKSKDNVIETVKPAKVERVLAAVGDLLAPDTPVLRVSYPDDLHIRIYVPEQNLSMVRVGDHSTVEVDGVSGAVECVVESIAGDGEFTPANLQTPEERGKQVFAVRMRPERADSRLKAGMSAIVRKIGAWTP